MSSSRVSVLLVALSFAVSAVPSPAQAAASGSDAACGLGVVVGAVNCASVTINRTQGYCETLNDGTVDEVHHCTVSVFQASGNALGWVNPGSYTISVWGSPGWRATCSGATSETKSWGTPAEIKSSGPFTIICGESWMYYGECGSGAGAAVRMTFTGAFAPRTIQAGANVGGGFHCIP